MSLADDLLAQAVELAALQTVKPNSANLRRAISSAYYALFHLLVTEATALLCPRQPASLASRFSRAFGHGDMKQVCRLVSQPRTPLFIELFPTGFSPQLQSSANIFVDLQQERHTADYDTAVTYSVSECQAVIDRAQDAFSSWQKIRGTDEATVFLTALLLHKQWSR